MIPTPTKPPAPKPRPLIGFLPEFRRNPAEFLQRMAREHGDIVLLAVGGQKIYLLTHPDFVRDVLITEQYKFKKSRMLERAKVLLGEGLLTSEGALHRRQRKLVQPAFHRDRLIGYGNTMIERTLVARERWQNEQTYDMSREMSRLTMDIVSRTLFSAHVEAEVNEISAALAQVFGLFDMILLPFSEYLEKLPLPSMLKFKAARKRLDETVYRLIASHRASGEDKGDLLSMLLLAQDDDQDEDGERSMSDTQVRDEVLTLFLAGHETTANALTWTWYLLSQNPAAEAAFHAELDSVLTGHAPAFDDLPNLRYTNAVFQESLRLYPPAWAIGRRALEDVAIGGYTIPKGDIALMSPYVTHRDPRWFPDPLRFAPERWLTEDPSRPKFAYFPFGGGARMCIGDRFAGMEGVLLLAAIGQKWRFDLAPGHPVELKPQVTLRPKYGMKMKFARR